MLPAVDAFSGIGGMTYALRGALRTVAYCEIDPRCQGVLRNNMRRKLIPQAPIVPDVKQLAGHGFGTCKPVVLLAGFPCQDVSLGVHGVPVGVRAGARSGLVRHLFTFLDAHPSVQAVFLENVASIVNRGHAHVVTSLERRGFSVRWGIFSAEEVGASHLRRRWFCLGVKNRSVKLRAVPVRELRPVDSVPRMLVRTPAVRADMQVRVRMLGNSVVPQCVAHAWNTLIKAHEGLKSPKSAVHVARLVPHGRTVFSVAARGFHRSRWGTPTCGFWVLHRQLAAKRADMLHNQLYYDDRTQAFLRKRYGWRGQPESTDRHFCANPEWVEVLMGYPPGFTVQSVH